jgi:hypothetical protein
MNINLSFNVDVVLLLIFVVIVVGAIILGQHGWYDGLKKKVLAF